MTLCNVPRLHDSLYMKFNDLTSNIMILELHEPNFADPDIHSYFLESLKQSMGSKKRTLGHQSTCELWNYCTSSNENVKGPQEDCFSRIQVHAI